MRYAFHPKLLYNIFYLWRQGATAATYFCYIRNNYPDLATCIPLVIKMANAQTPNEGVIDIVKRLKTNGYRLDILSNIDLDIFAELRTGPCAHIFDYFSHIKGTSERIPYGKPHVQIYKEYNEECNPDGHTVIFIDNKKQNIATAEKFGMIGIRFTSAKRLRDALENLGICVA